MTCMLSLDNTTKASKARKGRSLLHHGVKHAIGHFGSDSGVAAAGLDAKLVHRLRHPQQVFVHKGNDEIGQG